MFGMADDDEIVEKALMVLSSVVIPFQRSVNINLVTIIVDSGASSHYVDDAMIRDIKHRLQDYVHLAMHRKILIGGGALLDGTAEGVLQGLVADGHGNEILVQVDIVVVPGIGCNLFQCVRQQPKRVLWSSLSTKLPGRRDSTSPCHYGARATTFTRSCWT